MTRFSCDPLYRRISGGDHGMPFGSISGFRSTGGWSRICWRRVAPSSLTRRHLKPNRPIGTACGQRTDGLRDVFNDVVSDVP
jgi:hypothetical protein